MAKPFKQKVILELEDETSAGVGKVESRFKRLSSFLSSKFVITLGDVARIFQSLAGAIGDVVSASQEQEDAVKKLNQSLSSLGPQAETVSKALQDQAAALEQTTKFGDEAIIANQALALNLGVTAGDIGKLTEAAVELSSATGVSLESAFVNLSRTFNGFRGELGELIPELANLTEEQLKAGAAADVVLSRLGGSAAAEVQTYTGAVTQLGNTWTTVKEKLGAAIVENDAVVGSLRKLRELINGQQFQDSIQFVADGLSGIAAATANAATAIPALVREVQLLAIGFKELADRINDFFGPLTTLASKFNELRQSIVAAPFKAAGGLLRSLGLEASTAADSSEKLTKAEEDLGAAVEQTNVQLSERARTQASAQESNDAYFESISKLGVTLERDLNSQLETNVELLAQTDDAYRRGLITRTDYERVERALTGSAQELTLALAEQTTAVNGNASGFGEGTVAVEAYNASLLGLQETAASTAAALAPISSSLSSGPISLGTGSALRPSQFAAENKSTRIKTADGGSRLV